MLRKLTIYITTIITVSVIVSCSTANRAPVRDRIGNAPHRNQPSQSIDDSSNYHLVQPGEGLYRIGLRYGVTTADLITWNNISNENNLDVGQRLRVTPPNSYANQGNMGDSSGVIVSPIPNNRHDGGVSMPTDTRTSSTTPTAINGEIQWIWPTKDGAIVSTFTNASRGISIDGKAGNPVYASANGKVVFAGSSVPGLGNLIIIQHDNTYLSAYAHNQALLVKEDQKITAGQKIAEMGKSDSSSVKLHFEIRKNGQPVNPLDYLPRR